MILTPWPQSTRFPEIKPRLYVTSSWPIIEGLFGIISKLLKKYFSSTELKKSEAIEGWYKLLPTPQTDSLPITYAKKSKTYDIETEFNYGSTVSITDYKDWLSADLKMDGLKLYVWERVLISRISSSMTAQIPNLDF